ncbi:MAG: hypothetical protein WBE13_23575 [Candidatus Acidiferrum sp.]
MARRPDGNGATGGDAAVSLAVKNFIAAIDSDDSLFCPAQPLTGPSVEETKDDRVFSGTVYSGNIVLGFRQAEHSRQKSMHLILLQTLFELLKEAGSQEFLEAALYLTSGSAAINGSVGTSGSQEKPSQNEMTLWIRLAARGDSPEQALLRWGLGLAHIQQALLFTSRHLRMHLMQANG